MSWSLWIPFYESYLRYNFYISYPLIYHSNSYCINTLLIINAFSCVHCIFDYGISISEDLLVAPFFPQFTTILEQLWETGDDASHVSLVAVSFFFWLTSSATSAINVKAVSRLWTPLCRRHILWLKNMPLLVYGSGTVSANYYWEIEKKCRCHPKWLSNNTIFSFAT